MIENVDLSQPKFVIGKIYRRSTLHDELGGNRQSGISVSAKYRLIFAFSGDSGTQYGYKDEWKEGVFHYSGEGQVRDMEFTGGNLAIRDHVKNEKELHVFKMVEKAMVKYIGQMICVGTYTKQGLNKNGETRRVIFFELVPISEVDDHEPTTNEEKTAIANLDSLSLDELRKKAILKSTESSTPSERKSQIWKASQAIKKYAKKRAEGMCEGCGNPAPFTKKDGSPFLEVHHISRLSDGGPDDPHWVAAICPNCHRRSHYSTDMEEFNQSLKILVDKKETGFLNYVS